MANKININTASEEEIAGAGIPEVNDERAHDIVEFRESHGGIHSWDELRQIPGFNSDMVRNMRERAII